MAKHNLDYVMDRADEIIAAYTSGVVASTRESVHGIFSGGKDALEVLFGQDVAAKYDYTRMPIPPTLTQGLNRLAQKIGDMPGLKVHPASTKPLARKSAYDRQLLVEWMDKKSKLKLLLPQISRWTPPYGYGVYVLNNKTVRSGGKEVVFPHVMLRDPKTTFPSHWAVGTQPKELVTLRRVEGTTIKALYGVDVPTDRVAGASGATVKYVGLDAGYLLPNIGDNTGGVPITNGVTVAEFRDKTGTYVYLPDAGHLLDYIPSITGIPPFRIETRFDFRELGGQYDHIIGLLAMESRLNVLAQAYMADAINRETNIIGADGLAQRYTRGKKAMNWLPPGSRVESPQTNLPYQAFQLMGAVNQQLRDGASYPRTDDAQSNISFITGEGIQQLQASLTLEIGEYQIMRADTLEEIDAMRLEWFEAIAGGQVVTLNIHGKRLSVDPEKLIRELYETERTHGILSGFDRPAQIVTAIQLLQAKIVDLETVRQSLSGLGDINEIVNNIRSADAQTAMFTFLAGAAQQGDPAAKAALVEIQNKPAMMEKTLAKYFTPQEPQLSPEEAAFLGQGTEQAPLNSSTVLARLNASGSAALGAQTVGRV